MTFKKNFIINLVYYLLICALIVFFVKYILKFIYPLLIGLFIATAFEQACANLKLNKRKYVFLCLSVFYLLIICFSLLICMCLFNDLHKSNFYNIYPYISLLSQNLLDTDLFLINPNILNWIIDVFTYISTFLAKFIANVIKTLPKIFINSLLVILSSYFFVDEYSNIKFRLRCIPWLRDVKRCIFSTFYTVCKTYSIIFISMTILLFICFYTINFNNPLKYALLIAFLDLIPAIGVGLFFIPLIIFNLYTKDIILSVCFTIIYTLCIVLRNVLEPKLLSKSVCVHPILTLLFMFLGANIFGFLGLIFAPICLIFARNLIKNFYNV